LQISCHLFLISSILFHYQKQNAFRYEVDQGFGHQGQANANIHQHNTTC